MARTRSTPTFTSAFPRTHAYDAAACCLGLLGVHSVRLLTNNPSKVEALTRAGIDVGQTVPLQTSPHIETLSISMPRRRGSGTSRPLASQHSTAIRSGRPSMSPSPRASRGAVGGRMSYSSTHHGQVDGRIATRRGEAKWISSEAEQRISHGFRAACDAVLVGVETAIIDDPQLTVRTVPGPSPLRVVLDSTLRLPSTARVLDHRAGTVVIDPAVDRGASRLRALHIGVHVVDAGHAASTSRARSRRFEGSASVRSRRGWGTVITSFFAGLVDRLVVGIAPTIMGTGIDAVGDLGVARVAESVRPRSVVHQAGGDLLVAADVR